MIIFLESNTQSWKQRVNKFKTNVEIAEYQFYQDFDVALVRRSLYFTLRCSTSEVEKNSTPKILFNVKLSGSLISYPPSEECFRQGHFIESFSIVLPVRVQNSLSFENISQQVVRYVELERIESIWFAKLLNLDAQLTFGNNFLQNAVHIVYEKIWSTLSNFIVCFSLFSLYRVL